jgi:ArsR family transcriptional regulator
MDQKYLENAKVFKAFCDETRLRVLSLLQSGEKCACVLLVMVNVEQSTLSYHMKILVESGVVAARKEGRWMYYSICPTGSENAVNLLKGLVSTTIDETDTSNEECCKQMKTIFGDISWTK